MLVTGCKIFMLGGLGYSRGTRGRGFGIAKGTASSNASLQENMPDKKK